MAAGLSRRGSGIRRRTADAPAGLFDEVELPPAFVVDVGLIEDRGWAIVEFNPCWCAGLLSSDFEKVLNVLKRACRGRTQLAAQDRRWVLSRA